MKVYIVGTGVNVGDTLTKEAEAAIAEAELLIGAERMLSPFSHLEKEQFCSYVPQDITAKLRACDCGCAAVLMSGDCGFFSGAKKLLPLLEEHDVNNGSSRSDTLQSVRYQPRESQILILLIFISRCTVSFLCGLNI